MEANKKVIKTIEVDCSYCHKKVTKGLYYYNGAKRRGQKDFYHKDCSLKVWGDMFNSGLEPRRKTQVWFN
jgi:hypothetical protein